MRRFRLVQRYPVWTLGTLLLLAAPALPAQGVEANPLSPFDRLVGGEWHLADSYQQFEWGIGRRSVKARGYFVVDGKARLVSEGSWYWHPGKGEIKGTFTAIDMPVVFFDYTTRFEDGRMVNALVGYAPDGSAEEYVETWTFVDDSHVEWKLLQETPEGPVEVMGGVYERK